MNVGTDLLETVANVRRRARAVVRGDEPVIDRCRNLSELVGEVREEIDPEVRAWCERALHEEFEPFLDAHFPVVWEAWGDKFERAQRRLYAEGQLTCPLCCHDVATELDFDRWRAQREVRIAELEAFERAVPAEAP